MSSTLVLARVLRAPPVLVWQLWTEPAYVELWWGLKSCTIPVCELDVRPAGKWRIDMRTSDGTVYRNGGEYLVVEPLRRLVYSDVADPATAQWEGRVPAQRQSEVTFSPDGEHTRLTISIGFATAEDRQRFLGLGILGGIEQSLDKLEALITKLAVHPTG